MRDFRELIEGDRVYVFDGAMGTMLYTRGVYINRCFDELNLSSPDIVLGVHREYVKAGADIIESNTYGANRVKLAAYGMEDKIREVNAAGARLAREATGERALVAGAIGPLGIGIEPYGPTSVEEAKDIFRERLRARFAFVDQHLSTREYLLGKDYSIADAGLYAMTNWTPRVGFDIHPYPNLVAHHARIANRDAVREVHRIEGPIPA